MVKRISVILGVFIFIIIAFSSCSKFQKVLKSTDLNEKYKAAEAYYNKADYFHALQLFEELVTYYRGTTNAEKIFYYYAYCYYATSDFTTASYYFKSFASTYPNSKYAREAQYMSAYCSYLDSPEYSLDQTNTLSAVKELQLFVNMYPKSDSVKICNKLIDDLRTKLEIKEFEISKLYYKLEDYKASIVSFGNTLKDYPDTKYKEEILYLIMKANYIYASNSISSKKLERYQAALDAYNVLISTFAQSKYIKDAESVNKNSLKEINKIKNIKL
ncbi:MAG: outer membrane protein assembly factor BamD [Bacteroidetes bacterium]|nr:outer membrane protein assembly factor BamD [Bacteroidota bacterium]